MNLKSTIPRDLRGSLRVARLTWVAVVVVLLPGCGGSRESARQGPPSVTVILPAQEAVSDYLELTGTVVPSRSVELVARVGGYLESVSFEDGSIVEEGQLLFVIEPEPYKQQLALAEAALLRARSEYERQQGLIKENATSTANVEKWLSERDQAAAQVELAKLNLGYTRVNAPFSGRIGRRLVDPGNLVGPSVNTKLGTVDQLVPIYVYFNLNERDALRLWASIREQHLDRREAMTRKLVEVGVQNEDGYPHSGTLDFVGTGVSTSSGMVPMRAVLKNEDRVLFPGVFARVRIAVGEARPMLVVPNSAIGNDQEGDYVLVADANDFVARRTVVKGPLTGKGCAIQSGLTAEDRVIAVGLTRAKPGAKVTPVSAAGRDSASANEVR